MKHTDSLREQVRRVEALACKADGINPSVEDCTFSPNNPWLDTLKRARRNLVDAIRAEETHGALIIRTLGDS